MEQIPTISQTPMPASPTPVQTTPPTDRPTLKPVSDKLEQKIEGLIIFAYFFIASVLLFRFGLSLLGAKRQSPFVSFVYSITDPLLSPFAGMFGRSPSAGGYVLEFEVLVALLVYALALFGLLQLVKVVFR